MSDELPDDSPELFQLNSLMARTDSVNSWEGWGTDCEFVDEGTDIRDATIPQHIKNELNMMLEPLRFIKRFSQFRVDYPFGTHMKVRLSIPVKELGIKAVLINAWRLDPNKLLVLELDLGLQLLNTNAIPLVIGQANSVFDEVQPCRISFAVSNGLRLGFFKEGLEKLPQAEFPCDNIEKVMEEGGVEFFPALEALRSCKGKVDEAISTLQAAGVDGRIELNRQWSLQADDELNQRKTTTNYSELEEFSESIQQVARANHVSAVVVRLAQSMEEKEEDVVRLLNNFETVNQLREICGEKRIQQDELPVETIPLVRGESLGPSLAAVEVKERPEDYENVDPKPLDIEHDPKQAWKDGGRYQKLPPDQVKIAAYWVQYSHMVRLALSFEQVIIQCNKFCVICHNPMAFEGLKPAVCGRELCTMAFGDLGVGFNLAREILDGPDVADLYITFAYSAAKCNSMHFIVPINCYYIDPVTGKKDTFKREDPNPKTNNNNQYSATKAIQDDADFLDFTRLNACFDKCPSVDDLVSRATKGDEELRVYLNSLDHLLYPLLRWIFTSTRAHMKKLTPTQEIPTIQSVAQFALISSTPEREARFQRLKRAAEMHRGEGKGSFYAWHGSSTCNWHSILRTGLKNLSNTNLMSTGAAYGAGIYMAVESGTSLSYCRSTVAWPKSRFGATYRCLCLCEVVNHKDITPPNPYYVIQQEGWITTRFFFVVRDYDSFTVQANSLESSLPRLVELEDLK